MGARHDLKTPVQDVSEALDYDTGADKRDMRLVAIPSLKSYQTDTW